MSHPFNWIDEVKKLQATFSLIGLTITNVSEENIESVVYAHVQPITHAEKRRFEVEFNGFPESLKKLHKIVSANGECVNCSMSLHDDSTTLTVTYEGRQFISFLNRLVRELAK